MQIAVEVVMCMLTCSGVLAVVALAAESHQRTRNAIRFRSCRVPKRQPRRTGAFGTLSPDFETYPHAAGRPDSHATPRWSRGARTCSRPTRRFTIKRSSRPRPPMCDAFPCPPSPLQLAQLRCRQTAQPRRRHPDATSSGRAPRGKTRTTTAATFRRPPTATCLPKTHPA